VHVVSVFAGRSGSVVTLSTSLQDRPLLQAAVRTDSQLARRMEVTRSPDQDVVLRLHGVRHEALGRVPLGESPLLLCVGMLPDSRSFLVGWESLDHVLVATQAGTTDAQEHLAALVATLAGQCPPAEMNFYTVAGANTLLGQLAPLPHQRAIVDPNDREKVTELVASLRAEVERRQSAHHKGAEPELVVVVGELAKIDAQDDLAYLLTEGGKWGVRVLAATADATLERGRLVELFESRLVFGLEDEEASTRLLGTTWAQTLAETGRLLVKLGRRKEVEVLGLHLNLLARTADRG